MGLFIIFVSILIVGVVGLIIYNIFWNKFSDGVFGYICLFFTLISSLVVIGLSISAIHVNANRRIDYEEVYYEYTMLNKKLQEDANNYLLLYTDIVAYNNKVLNDRYWANNFWVGWYNNGLIKNLPLLEIE